MPDPINRYATQDIFVPADSHHSLGEFVSRSEKERKPFARQVDIWWVAFGIGVRMGYQTTLPAERVKFNTAAILNTDPWRITHLELVAVSVDGDRVLNEPARVIQIASEYAATGLPWLIDCMLGEAEPTLTLMNRIDKYIVSPSSSSAEHGSELKDSGV